MILLVPLVIACALLLSMCGSMRNAQSHSDMLTGGMGLLSSAPNDPRQTQPRVQPTPTLDSNIPLDLEGAGLICVRLPGNSFPKTPALDRRVAPLHMGVVEEMERRKMAPLFYNYSFRSTCEQTRITPVGTALKAPPGSSAHEAAAALDAAELQARSDRQLIVAIFKQFGWRHGTADWPHFQIMPSTVGERDYGSWIKRQQANFNANRIEGNCKGLPCGGL